MAEFKNYTSELYQLFESFQKNKSTQYRQICGMGGDFFMLNIRNSRIESMHTRHDLSVDVCIGEKKNKSWRIYRQSSSSFDEILPWQKQMDYYQNRNENGSDPRPVHPASYIPDTIPNVFPNYDTLIDGCDPTLVFHRTFQTLSGMIEDGIMLDAQIIYHTGAHNWQYTPVPFVYIDHQNFYYKPQTHIHETITFYPGNKSWQRQTVHHYSHTLNQTANFTELQKILHLTVPMLRLNAHNIDRIILSPVVTAVILKEVLNQISDLSLSKSSKPCLSPELKLICNASDKLFQCDGMTDITGHPTESVVLIENGHISGETHHLFTQTGNHSQHGHALTRNREAAIFYPILCASSSSDLPDYLSSVSFSASNPEKILFPEPPVIRYTDAHQPYLWFTTGGPVYSGGKYLGYAVGCHHCISLYELLKTAIPVSLPVRIGNLGTCALQINPDHFYPSEKPQ